MRLIDCDVLKIDYVYQTDTTGAPCNLYVSKEQLDLAPTIKAEPVRRGRWVATVGGVYCSECADAWSDEVESMIQSFNYCPNCGAKMEV